ncbi:MAG: choice-of-anchor D domain-containing protein [Candidatus Omnitrophica bacterium]|nr:choice-of-anchor D domain-containing protein [Candidatus Omnitrophota bacterium]
MGKLLSKSSLIFLFSFFCYAGSISISYRGLDNVHLNFSDRESTDSTIVLTVEPGGEALYSKKLPPGGGTIEENFHHTGLSKGTYTYKLYADSELRATEQVTIDGTIGGTLLFDETINDAAIVAGNVIVPAGRSLTVNGNLTALSGFNLIDCYGVVSFSEGISINGIGVYLYNNPVSIKNIKGLSGLDWLRLYSGASGSSIENCEGFDLIVGNNTSASVKRSLVGINIDGDNASISVMDSTVSLVFFQEDLSKTNIDLKDSTILLCEEIDNAKNFNASNCLWRYPLDVIGGQPVFENCEFVYQVTFRGRNEAMFTNCVFGDMVQFNDWGAGTNPKWSDSSSMQPNFSGCSFVGRIGPVFPYMNPSGKVNLGSNNYFGDKNPDFEWFSLNAGFPLEPQAGWFLHRGVPVNKNHFELSNWVNSGTQMKNQKTLPSIWLNDYVVGQNCLPYAKFSNPTRNYVLLKGQETLVSLDVATNYESISGVKFTAIFDGQEILPENPGVVLHRDISKYAKDVFYGNTTVNFILPPTDKDNVELKIMMDTTNINGFDEAQGKGERIILDTFLQFKDSYGRQLNIVVQPVQLFITGYTTKMPNATAVVNSLKKLIPAMLPISQDDLHIISAPVTTFYGGILSMFSTTALLNRIANYLATAQGFINTTASIGDWVSGKETARVDFVVAVLPNGVLGQGVTGANLSLRRGVVFVDENYPDAALHEMGHGIGLYTGTEQYDQFPPTGLPVEGLTAFINEPSASNSINGFRNRFLHFPRKEHSWYEDKFWFDIMGSGNLSWPIWTTFSAFRNYFQSYLGVKTKSIQYSYSKVPSGYRRIFISAETEKTSYAGYGYKIVQGTIKSFDITDFATGKIDVPVFWDDDNCASNDYKIVCYDEYGTIIHWKLFTVVTPYPSYTGYVNWPEESSWYGTFDIPENTKKFKIYTRNDENIFEVNSTDYEGIKISSPVQGVALTDSVEISWMASQTKSSQELNYIVMASNDGGNTWFPISIPTEQSKITIPTDFLHSSNNIIFKVIGSNGLGNVSDEVSGLKIENRKPKAIIKMPKDGWIGEKGTKWELKGYGEDIEDGIIASGIWTSSIDGRINTDTDVILSPGKHTLTFEVEDSGGLKDSASIEMEVKEIEQVDLGIREGDLSVIIEGKDPLNTSPVQWLKKDGTHRVILRIQNTGTDTIFTCSLYITEPGQLERLLGSKNFVAEPFEEEVISETFIAGREGQYQIRGEITNIVPEDTNSGNNQRIWVYQTKPKLPVIGISPETVDFGSARSKKQGYILIRNYGDANLQITNLALTGANAGEFSFDDSILQQQVLPDNNIFVSVYFNPASTGTKNAILNISSNDSTNSAISVNLTGICNGLLGDINGGGVDISDVILCLRMAIGIDPVDIESADMNDDGVIDISDVILILRKAIGLD